jgi:hypothetical protein
LCFSVGEGLRLMPFPAPARSEAAAPDGRLKIAELRAAQPHEYGPLDKPTQSHKRGKRPTQDDQFPPSQIIRKPAAYLLRCPATQPRVALTSGPPVERAAGRAPPHTA